MLFWTSAVFAATPDELYDFQRSVDNLTLQPELYRQIEEPLVIREGPLTVTLQSGAMVPIFSGRFANEWEKQHEKMLKRLSAKEAEPPAPDQRGSRDVVGFVWLDGEATVELAVEGADAQRLANRLVLEGGLPREAMAEVVAGAPFRTRADRGLVLSADPEVDTWFLGSPDGDPYEIVVWEKPSDLGGARALLQSRLRVWREVGYDWADLVAADRVEAHAGLPNDPVRLVDLQTSDRYRMVSDLPDGSEDRWLAAATVPSGAVDTRWRTRVLAAGRAPEGKGLAGRIAGVPFPPTDPDDATSQRLSPHAVKRVAAKGRVLVQPTDTFLDMEAAFRVTVTLEASAPTAFLDVELPRVEAIAKSFEVQSITIDGKPVMARGQVERADSAILRPKEDPEEKHPEVDASKVRLYFPHPLQAGERVDVLFEWKDTWPYAKGCGDRAQATGIQSFLPEIPGTTGGGPWDFEVTVGVPTASKLAAVVSGERTELVEKQGWTLSTSKGSRGRWPSISVGRFDIRDEPAAQGMPAVRVHLLTAFPGQIETMGVEARRAIAYYQGWLPEFPVRELELVEAPPACGYFVWKAPYGMAELQRMRLTEVGGAKEPKLASGVYAHEIAHQYWGQVAQPASSDDRWIAETFAETYACMYVAAAFQDTRMCEVRLKGKRETWESSETSDVRSTGSLTDARNGVFWNQAVYDYGPYLMLEMLRPRVGTEAFFRAFDVLLRDHPAEPLTTERLQRYLELSSGQDLGPFFDFWVRGGRIPKVDLRWTKADGGVRLKVTSDVPFGTFDIPVRLTQDERSEDVMVVVVDGEGSLDVPGWSDPKIELDPLHRTLSRKRRSGREK